jgi:hypothetical protein
MTRIDCFVVLLRTRLRRIPRNDWTKAGGHMDPPLRNEMCNVLLLVIVVEILYYID